MKSNYRIIATIAKPGKILGLLLIALWLNTSLSAQCTASFTYTLGTNGQVSLTNTSVGTTTNTTTNWSWSGWSGYGSSTQQSPTFTFTYNGTYYIYLSIYDSLANCQSYATDTVVITNAQPCQVSFTYTASSIYSYKFSIIRIECINKFAFLSASTDNVIQKEIPLYI